MIAPSLRSIAMQPRSLVIALASTLLVVACGRRDTPPAEAPAATSDATTSGATADTPSSTDTGALAMSMQKTDLAPGNGAEIKSGQTALVHYTGWLYDAAAPE